MSPQPMGRGVQRLTLGTRRRVATATIVDANPAEPRMR